MEKIAKKLTDLVGNTPLLELSNYNKNNDLKARLIVKIESFNPAGSVKDRIALAMIEDAETKGVLQPGATIIEPTSGNTGVGLAFVSAAKGYKLILTMPDTMSIERRNLLKALGAELVLTPGTDGMKGAIAKAEDLKGITPGAAILQQFENPANPAMHLRTTLGGLTYSAGNNQASTKLTIQSTKLHPTYYLLPLCLTNADSETVLIDKSVRILTLVRGYCNPIIAFSAPDPTVIRAQDGYFYLYGTENTRNVPIYRSKDLVNWEYKGTAFTDATRPTWGGDHNIWAPEIRYFNNHYVLYYSWAIWGDEWRSNVGVAVSDSPLGPFIDKGCLIDSKVIGVQNSIDQFFYEDNGKKYMFWGSFRGIYATELTDNGLEIKKNTDGTPVLKKRICGNRFEGTNIYKRGEYYYLFASIGTCCNGATSTYQTVVGRSKNVLGPYLDKTGRDMLYDYCEIIMSGNETWAGPGHNSILIQDDVGTDWIIYHGYKKKEAENGRYVLMDKLIWSNDGWPSVKSNAPSILEVAPYFQK